MARRATNISLDAAVKQILRDNDFATRKDLDRLGAKIDQLEKAVNRLSSLVSKKGMGTAVQGTGATKDGLRRTSATSKVFESIKRSKKGMDFATLQKKTGFEEKKLRNIIFRLHKLGYIQRVERGRYAAK
ncbi:MAG: hypothetical protein B5M56_02390 [Desulfococcus sp. 4484_241]|nr:MAG: hypothetical protein B5M56_02390 [Desulfococcus sp. 4484_241]